MLKLFKKTKTEPTFDNLEDVFKDFVVTAEKAIGQQKDLYIPDVIEFTETFLNLGNIGLTIYQRLILKCLYNLNLSEEDLSILEYWKSTDKTTFDFDIKNKYQILVIQAGRRSSKTLLAGIIATYEFFCLVRIGNPQAYYKIASGSPIGILCLATTSDQAKRTIFRQVQGLVKSVPYLLDLESKGEIFIGKEEIACESKQVYLYAGNSKSGSQVGANLKCLVMDEVARFQSADGDNNALELWSNLGIAGAPFKSQALRVAISSAWEDGDAIEQLYNTAKVTPSMIGFNCCSWDINPIIAARDNEVVMAEYAANPIIAALEFENIRPKAAMAFLNYDEVRRAFTGKSIIKVQRNIVYEPNPLVELNLVECETTKSYSSVIHVDPAIQKDAYALAMGHLKYETNSDKPLVVIDFICAWEPDVNTQVKLSNVYDLIKEIHQYRNILKVSADHFNSAETMQKLNADGIPAESVFFSNRTQITMYDTVRTLLHENRLILPNDSFWTPLLQLELARVELKNGGTKIDHPKTGSKDIADAVAAVCTILLGNPISINKNKPVLKAATVSQTFKVQQINKKNKFKEKLHNHNNVITKFRNLKPI